VTGETRVCERTTSEPKHLVPRHFETYKCARSRSLDVVNEDLCVAILRLGDCTMLRIQQDHTRVVVGNSDGTIWTVAFHPDGIHFYGGTTDGIRRWRVADGHEAGKQAGMDLNAISVSRNGKWILCGTMRGASVWDAELQRKVVEVEDTNYVGAVDVSPESTRFATATRSGRKANIWSITTGERLAGPLEHEHAVRGIKFSPDGGHIATASEGSIHVFDSHSGHELITIKNPLLQFLTTPVIWPSDGRLFTLSEGGKIKSFDTSTGSQIAEWEIHSHDSVLVVSALSGSNRFIASSAGHSISFWDTSTHTQVGSGLEDGDQIQSIALSPDGTRLATGGKNNKTITIWNLSDILPESYLRITVSTTLLMLGRAITFVYRFKPLFSLNPECEWSSISLVYSAPNIPLVISRPKM
jgi:WD40 repeat protein